MEEVNVFCNTLCQSIVGNTNKVLHGTKVESMNIQLYKYGLKNTDYSLKYRLQSQLQTIA